MSGRAPGPSSPFLPGEPEARQHFGVPAHRLRSMRSGLGGGARVIACGNGGIDGLAAHVSDSTVQWALLRFEVGEGSFQRTKLVDIHINGEETPAMRRGRLNAHHKDVIKQTGAVHASMEVYRRSELTTENLCSKMQFLFLDDPENSDVARLRKTYEKNVQRTRRQAALSMSSAGSMSPVASISCEQHRVGELGPGLSFSSEVIAVQTALDVPCRSDPKQPLTTELDVRSATRDVANPNGEFNWVLLRPATEATAADNGSKPALEVFNAGSGGLEEMKWELDNQSVLFGLLRMSFQRPSAATDADLDDEPCCNCGRACSCSCSCHEACAPLFQSCCPSRSENDKTPAKDSMQEKEMDRVKDRECCCICIGECDPRCVGGTMGALLGAASALGLGFGMDLAAGSIVAMTAATSSTTAFAGAACSYPSCASLPCELPCCCRPRKARVAEEPPMMTRHVFAQWMGTDAGPDQVKRAEACRQVAEKAASDACGSDIIHPMKVNSLEALELGAVTSALRDHDLPAVLRRLVSKGPESDAALSVEGALDGLAREQRSRTLSRLDAADDDAAAADVASSAEEAPAAVVTDQASAILEVRRADGDWDWVLLGPSDEAPARDTVSVFMATDVIRRPD